MKVRRRILSRIIIGLSSGICILGILGFVWYFFIVPQGVREAREQIWRGHLTLYTGGLRDFDKSYDPDTGLPLQGIAGCIVDKSFRQRAEDHNKYIKNWIAQRNIPPNSLRAYNKLIADPFSEIAAVSFVNLTAEKPVNLNDLKITYSKVAGSSGDYNDISVKSRSVNWSHTVWQDARSFRTALVADGRILAITYLVDGKESFAGKTFQSIQLFDLPTGISLNYVYKEIDKSE